MKLNEPTLADPLLLTGCALGGPPWGSGGPFTTQDLISTTTFPDDNLLLSSPPPHHGVNNNNNNSGSSPPSSALKGGSPPNGSTGVELDALLIVGSSDSFAELKPLPPFEYAAAGTTVVVGALSLQNDPHLPQMGPAPNQHNHHQQHNNNNSSNHNSSSHSNRDNNNHPNPHRNGGGGGSTGNSLVSSPNGTNFSSSVGGSPLFDPVSSSTSVPANIKSELAEYLLNSDIDDIAALIGNAIADSTVPNLGLELDPNGVSSSADTPDPWMEFETWIESACQQSQQQQQQSNNGGGGPGGRGSLQNGQSNNPNNPNNNSVLLDQDATIHTSASDQNFLDGSTSTLQTLLEADSYSSGPQNNPMFHQDIKHNPEFHPTSILQSRLQQPILGGQLLRVTSGGNGGSNNGSGGGGPNTSPSQIPESTTHQQHHPNSIYGLKVDPYTLDPGSPTYIDSLTGEVNQRPHTTHVSPPAVVTSSMMSGGGGGGNGPNSNNNKYRKQYKISNNKQQNGGGPFHHPSPDGNTFLSPYGGPTSSPFDTSPNGMNNGHHHQQSKLGIKTKRKSSKLPSSSTLGIDPLDPCGKEKPVHRCNICNRGFLNKSNIKVHLRTHTGEKPFKCDVCGKAFRQKAHLLKHVQIHKRIQRD